MALPTPQEGSAWSLQHKAPPCAPRALGELRLVLSTATSVRLGSQTVASLAFQIGSVQQAKTGTRALGGRSVCVPPLPPIRSCFPATSCALWSLFWVRCCCIIHTTSCQIDQTIALCLFISKLVGEAGREECTTLLELSRVAESRWVSKARKRVREGDGKLLGRQSRRKMGEEGRRQNKGQLDGKGCLAQGDGIVL